MTPAQSAALEAFEEAGVHGRIEQLAFASYRRASADSKDPVPTLAFLCEVRRLSPPQESGRDRTWFSVEKAKRRLQDGRSSACSAEFLAVLDRAVTRIRRLRNNSDHRQISRSRTNDSLQRMYFEASETLLAQKMAASFLRMQRRSSSAIESRNFPPRKLLTSGSPTIGRPRLVIVEGKPAAKPQSRRTR
jgi:hypothetical protein